MAEYINRECLLDAMQAEREGLRPLYDNYALGFEKGILLVKCFPYADVAPVVHGRWDVKVGMNFFRERICPVCKKRIESNFWDFCPNCGARMDGDAHG